MSLLRGLFERAVPMGNMDPVFQHRVATCQQCPQSFLEGMAQFTGAERGRRCFLCKCFVNPKARMRNQQCPEGRWGA